MKYMLDTNMCIYFMQDDLNVKSAFLKKRKDGVVISAIVLSELEYGINNSNSITTMERNKNKLISFLALIEILPFDSNAAAEYGKINAALRRVGMQIGVMDTLIAAHAKSVGLILVTNNTREFERVDGLVLENWYHSSSA